MSFHKEMECRSIAAKPTGIKKEHPQIAWKVEETASIL